MWRQRPWATTDGPRKADDASMAETHGTNGLDIRLARQSIIERPPPHVVARAHSSSKSVGGCCRCADAVAISHAADRRMCGSRERPSAAHPLSFADPRGAVSHEPRPKLACHYPRLMSVT